MKELTSTEEAVLAYAQQRGLNVPDCIVKQDGKLLRPERYTAEQNAEYASLLSLYVQHEQSESLGRIRTWVTVLGVITILGVVLNILF